MRLKALITGASGFVGQHLSAYLAQETALDLIGTTRDPLPPVDSVRWVQLDLRDPAAFQALLAAERPNFIYHLAGQAFVPASFDDPWETLETNIRCQVNLLESLVKLKLDARVLVVGSAHVYGKISPDENPVDENHPFRPDNPYSVSKVAQDMLALQYHLAYGLDIIRARPFNHIGPGQDMRFALANFAAQIAALEKDMQAGKGAQEPVIYVGNLNAARDFTDVRDVVRAYHALMERGTAGEVYNICRGQAHTLQHLLDQLVSFADVQLRVEVDAERLRPLDVPLVVGNNQKLRQATAWQAKIDIQTSLQDILQATRHTMIRNNS